MDVSENSGAPKSSILIGVFHYKPSILGCFPIFGNIQIDHIFSVVAMFLAEKFGAKLFRMMSGWLGPAERMP